jgi:hypothetical protein
MERSVTQQFDYLESRIRQNLEALSAKVESIEQPITSRIGFSKNDFFPLRAHLSFLRDRIGDEVVLSVDVKKYDGGFIIECEILKGEGQILAEMPSLNIEINAPTIATSSSMDRWVTSFEGFLIENFDVLRSAVHSLGPNNAG